MCIFTYTVHNKYTKYTSRLIAFGSTKNYVYALLWKWREGKYTLVVPDMKWWGYRRTQTQTPNVLASEQHTCKQHEWRWDKEGDTELRLSRRGPFCSSTPENSQSCLLLPLSLNSVTLWFQDHTPPAEKTHTPHKSYKQRLLTQQ